MYIQSALEVLCFVFQSGEVVSVSGKWVPVTLLLSCAAEGLWTLLWER